MSLDVPLARRRPFWTADRMAVLAALPLLVFLFLQFFVPVGLLLATSVTTPQPGLQHFARLINRPAYVRIFLNTFELAVSVTAITAAVAYPIAYYLSVARAFTRDLLLFFILVPFWTSILVRTYGLMVLLGRNGLANVTLIRLGILEQPIQFLFNGTIVRLAMVQILLPFFVLPLYATMRGIDGSLVQAAAGLGAAPIRAFHKVYWPLSLPGVFSGAIIVFVLSFGFFITPALLGGRTDVTVAMLIFQQFDALLNWGFGAALSSALLAATLVILALFARFAGPAVAAERS